MNIRQVFKRCKQRTLSISRRKLGKQQLRGYREAAFRRSQQLRGLPNVKTSLCFIAGESCILLNCRLLDPEQCTQQIGLRFKNGAIQWIDKELIHYRTSPTSLSKTLLRPEQADRFTGLIHCEQAISQLTALVLTRDNGKQLSVALKAQTSTSCLSIIAQLLELIPRDSNEKRRVFDDALGKLITDLWAMRPPLKPAEQLIHYNEASGNTDPLVSIIVPIYGRYDFIEYQLALFANDEFMHQQEIIYVIDDPRLNAEVTASCQTLARIYKIPFKLLLLKENIGYAGANNVGVAHASGEQILLLNSDVFPEKPGWLLTLLDALESDPKNTLLGARLKYHDESVQHDGMSFFSSPFAGGLWINIHPGKGLPADQFSCTTEPQKRESVTGAGKSISG